MAIPELEIFSPSRILKDVERTATAFGAPFSESTTRAVIEAYRQCFEESAVLWRITDRPGDQLNFRFYNRRPVDTVKIAVDAGLIKADNVLLPMINSWSSLYKDTSRQLCDFGSKTGLTKTWVFFGANRPLEDILSIRDVPDTFRRHEQTFRSLGLSVVTFVAADYQSKTFNIYFAAPGPLSEEHAARLVDLAGGSPPTSSEVQEIREFCNPYVIPFAVTLAYDTGDIQRVAFYAIPIPSGKYPTIDERLTRFFAEVPSYSTEQINIIGWSFGKGGKKYIKAERSYYGEPVRDMANLLVVGSS